MNLLIPSFFLKIENIEPTEGMLGGRQAEVQQFHHANLGLDY